MYTYICNIYILIYFFCAHCTYRTPYATINNGFYEGFVRLMEMIHLQREDLCLWLTQYLRYNKAQMVCAFPKLRQLAVGPVAIIVPTCSGQKGLGTHLMIGNRHRAFSLYCVTG